MSLDFEKLSQQINTMAQTTFGRMQNRQDRIAEVLDFMSANATAWKALEQQHTYIENAFLKSSQSRPFRGSARPLRFGSMPLNAQIACDTSKLPPEATIISADGSQIVPDRHAPYVYYLLNVGGIIYHHGNGQTPETFNEPTLKFPKIEDLEDFRFTNYASVTIERDLAEIDILAFTACERKEPTKPLLAVMDQRLLYVPTGELAPQFKEKTIRKWQEDMERVEACGAWLAGYIDRPMKSAVIAMLRGIHPGRNVDNPDDLGEWTGLIDADLFGRILAPGQRSKIFVDVSFANERFKQKNQVCFFYLNPGRSGEAIARVDLPLWVARDGAAVDAIHALLYDQCQILGNYPYVIARADEMAVVKRRDQEELEFKIGRQLDAFGVEADITAKAQTKLFLRSDKQRHGQ